MDTELSTDDIVWETYRKVNPIKRNQIYLFKINVTDFYYKISNHYQSILSTEELSKTQRYINPIDSKRDLVSKYATRMVLSNFIDIPPEKIFFSKKFNKKPSVKGIEFNVSHSGNLVLIAVAQEPIGVDLEIKRDDFDFMQLLIDSFHDDEVKYILNSHDQLSTFYKIWTRKEALLKATGEGLIDEMNSLCVITNEVERLGINYYLFSFKVDENHIGCFVSSVKKVTKFYDYP